MYKNINTLIILFASLIICYIFYNVYILENFDMPEFKMPDFFKTSSSSKNDKKPVDDDKTTECNKKLKDNFLKKQKADKDKFYKENSKCLDDDSKK